MPFLPALVPAIVGLALPGMASGLGALGVAGLGGIAAGTIGGDILGAGAGALAGGLMQHSALGALEGAAGGFGGAALAGPLVSGISDLGSALGASAGPLGAMGQDVLSPAVMSATGQGLGSTLIDTGAGLVAPSALPSIAAANGGALNIGGAATGALSNALGGAASGAANAAGPSLPSLVGTGLQGASGLGQVLGGPSLGLQSGQSGALPLPPTPPPGNIPPGSFDGPQAPVIPSADVVTNPAANPSVSNTSNQAAPSQTGAPSGSGGGGANKPGGALGTLDDFLKSITGAAPLALTLGGLGYDALKPSAIPGVGASTSSINPQSALGQQLGIAQNVQGQIQPTLQHAAALQATASPLVNAPVTGQLPPAVAAAFQTQLANQITAIKSQYASLGESGSTAELVDIQNAQNAMQAQMANMLLQYGQQGLSTEQAAQNATTQALQEAGLPSETYGNIANLEIANDQQLGQAITNIASAASGSLSQRPQAA